MNRKTTTILQSESSECGLACMAIMLNYHGFHIDLQGLRDKFEVSNRGMSLRDLISVAEHMQLDVAPVKIELEDLVKVPQPLIIHWQFEHFVVLEQVKHQHYYINDPAFGRQKLSQQQFSASYTGVALRLQPNRHFKPQSMPAKTKAIDLIADKKDFFSKLTRVFFYSVLFQALVVISPFYLQIVIDRMINVTTETAAIDMLLVLSGLFALVLLLEILFNFLRSILLAYLGGSLTLDIAGKTFNHMLHLPLRFFVKRHVGDLVSRFTAIQRIRSLFTSGIVEAIVSGITTVVSLILMFHYSVTLTLVVIASVCIYSLVKLLVIEKNRMINDQIFQAESVEQTGFYESVKSIEQVKLMNRQQQRAALYQAQMFDTIKADIALSKLSINMTLFNRLVFGLELLIIVYLSVEQINNHQFTLGMLFAFIFFRRNFVFSMAALIDNLTTLNVVIKVHFQKLSDILNSKAEAEKNNHQSKANNLISDWTIELKQLSFRYSDFDKPVLENINLTINNGESIAITGPSGQGKTTLMKLMLGLFEPMSGQITVGDINIWQLGINHYRDSIAAIMQEDQILTGTIINNITFFADNINLDKAKQCAKAAQIHNDIMNMPMNYHTQVGNMGGALSGGQKQRLFIARALYLEPKILFMDEATSHLDAETEQLINQTIKRLKITRIIIAHRKETINSADKVYCIKDGHLAPAISHQRLDSGESINYEH